MGVELDSFLSPQRARSLPPGRRQELAELALRQLWHTVFDPCPKLASRFPPNGKEFLDPFLEHAAEERLSMRWSLHLRLLSFLSLRFPAMVDAEISFEATAAAALRWTSGDLTPARTILIAVPGGGTEAVRGRKCASIREPARLHRVALSIAPALDRPVYAVSNTWEMARNIEWSEVPR